MLENAALQYLSVSFISRIRHALTLVEQGLKSDPALDERKIHVNKVCFAFLNASFVLQLLVNLLYGWSSRRKLVQFMNSWVDLKRNLSSFLKSDKRRVTTEPVHYYATLCLTVVCYLGVGAMFSSISTDIPSHADRALELTIFGLVFGYLFLVESLKDYFVVFVFYELLGGFRQVMQKFIFIIS